MFDPLKYFTSQGRLKGALMLQFKEWPENKRPTITMPPNLQEVKLEFARRRSAKVIGSLVYHASSTDTAKPEFILPQEGDVIQGILVTQNNSSKIVAPDDLATYTPLRVGSVSSTLHVPFVTATSSDGKSVYIDTFRFLLNGMFSGVIESTIPLSSSIMDNDSRFVEAEQDEEDMNRIQASMNVTDSRAGFRSTVFSLLNDDASILYENLNFHMYSIIIETNFDTNAQFSKIHRSWFLLEKQLESQLWNGMQAL